jgi:hypothetical protein
MSFVTDKHVLSRRRLLRAGATTGVAGASLALPIGTLYGTTGPELAPPPGDHQFQAQTPVQQPAALGGFTYFTTFRRRLSTPPLDGSFPPTPTDLAQSKPASCTSSTSSCPRPTG